MLKEECIGGGAQIFFQDVTDQHPHIRKNLTNNFELCVGLHTDEITREAFEALSVRNPTWASQAKTFYYFTTDGSYKKISLLPDRTMLNPSRKQVPVNAGIGVLCESQMTAGDFELAGRAIDALINRLRPQEKSAE